MVNTIWRFLALRDYVDEKHQLSPWGKVLLAALETAKPTKEQWESSFIAIELVRLGHLNSEPILPSVGKNLGGMYRPGSTRPYLTRI